MILNWYNACKNANGQCYFIENKMEYINLNENKIPLENIIYHDYKNINVKKSFNMSINEVLEFDNPPQQILNLPPFDIIFINSPEGYSNEKPGRLLPCIWSRNLFSNRNTIIYIDDSNRKLEKHIINNFFNNYEKYTFHDNNCLKLKRDGCTKLTLIN